jgi:Flp pilus assembly protein TadG
MVRKIRNLTNDTSGSALVEAAVVLPVFILILFAVMQSGFLFYSYIALTDATAAGVRQFSIERSFSTPWTDTVNQVKATALALTAADLTISMSVNGTACASDSACANLLSTAQGQEAQVATTYACNFQLINSLPNPCPLRSTMTGRVQ